MIKVEQFTLGAWMVNSYVVYPEGQKNCWIIDAGFEPEPMIEALKAKDLKPELLIYTHAHLDHIAGGEAVVKAFPGIKSAIHSQEAAFLSDASLNMSSQMGMNITAPVAELILSDDQKLEIGGSTFKVIHTPGHSPGGICLYCEDERLMFSGDTLFEGSVGRYDFPTSDGEKLFSSIREKLLFLPEDTKVYPGHGNSTRIGREKRSNPFL